MGEYCTLLDGGGEMAGSAWEREACCEMILLIGLRLTFFFMTEYDLYISFSRD